MNNKTATLGIGAAVIGIFTALVGAALAGKGAVKRVAGDEGKEAGATSPPAATSEAESQPTTQTAAQPPAMEWPTPASETLARPAAADEFFGLLPPAGATDVQSPLDGPSGPTAHARPAPTGDEGHAAPDLASDALLGPDHRAPEAFRPDMDAPMTAAEREALRPATGPSPSLVSDEGAGVQGPGGSLT